MILIFQVEDFDCSRVNEGVLLNRKLKENPWKIEWQRKSLHNQKLSIYIFEDFFILNFGEGKENSKKTEISLRNLPHPFNSTIVAFDIDMK